MTSGKRERRYDLDWLRVFAMLTIFLFHCARFFNEEDWHVKNNQLSHAMSLFVGIVSQWIMPLFFILSAVSCRFSLRHRNGKQYLFERSKRLLVPLLFGSFVVIAPLQVWIERASHGQFSGSFFEFYPIYFHGFYGFGGNFAWMGLHLWYLEVLFIFSLLTLPLFLWLRREKAALLICSGASLCRQPGVIFLLGVPVAAAELLVNLHPEGVGMRAFGGWSLLTYLVFFILGYVVASDTRCSQAIERHRRVALGMGIMTTLAGAVIIETGLSAAFGYVFMNALRAFNSWFWLVAILGFGSRHLKFSNRALIYSNEGVLPFYIMHQTVIVGIGFMISDLNINVTMKYLLISTMSFLIIIALYEGIIRRINGLRLLFGMK